MSAIVTENRGAAEPLRVALVITELNVGGAERCLVELATRLDRNRFAPAVISLGPRPLAGKAALVERLEAATIPVYFLDARSTRSTPRTLWRLVKLLRRERPRLVQTFLFHANALGCVAARLSGIKTVLTGVRVAERQNAWHLRWAQRLDPWVTRHVCVSQSVADFMAKQCGFAAEKLVVIPNGVDIARFRDAAPVDRGSLGLAVGRKFLVSIGRLDPQKGLDRLLRVAPTFLPALADHDLVFVGDGPERTPLESLSRSLGLQNRVHWAGWRADVPAVLAASDGLLLPSRWEGMPNVVLEAMAAGKPVAALPAEGVRELLGDASPLQVAASDDTQLFAANIVTLFSLTERASQIGAANRAIAEQQFSLEAMANRYSELYLELSARSVSNDS